MAKLYSIEKKIKEWCQKNGIGIFKGRLQHDLRNKLTWENNSPDANDYENFLGILKFTETKILILDTIVNEIDISDEEIIEYKNSLSNEEKWVFEKSLSVVSKKQNEIVLLRIMFFERSLCYEFNMNADWIGDYSAVHLVYAENEPENNGEPGYTRLNESTIENQARKVILDTKFLEAKSFLLRQNASDEVSEKDGVTHWHNKLLIARKAEAIFLAEVTPKKEAEIKNKILTLKEKGLKKVQIKGQLGISQTVIDKFYYLKD